MAETRTINKHYEELAEKIIEKEDSLRNVANGHARIVYLESDFPKKDGKDMAVLGQCEKVAARHKWAINYDFMITIFKPNTLGMSEEQLKILLFHELLHVGIERNDEGGEIYSIRKHDFTEFREIVERYGANWSKKGPKLPELPFEEN